MHQEKRRGTAAAYDSHYSFRPTTFLPLAMRIFLSFANIQASKTSIPFWSHIDTPTSVNSTLKPLVSSFLFWSLYFLCACMRFSKDRSRRHPSVLILALALILMVAAFPHHAVNYYYRRPSWNLGSGGVVRLSISPSQGGDPGFKSRPEHSYCSFLIAFELNLANDIQDSQMDDMQPILKFDGRIISRVGWHVKGNSLNPSLLEKKADLLQKNIL